MPRSAAHQHVALPLTAADWSRAWRGLTAPLRAYRGGFAAVLVSVCWFLASVLTFFVIARVLTYGVVWHLEGGAHDDAWGGPTLLGAWSVHALIGLALLVAAMSAIRPLSRAAARLNERR